MPQKKIFFKGLIKGSSHCPSCTDGHSVGEPEWVGGKEIGSRQGFYTKTHFYLALWSRKVFKITAHWHSMGEVWAKLKQRERSYAQDKWKNTERWMERMITMKHLKSRALIIFENIPGICYSALRVWTVLVAPSVYLSVHCLSGCVTPGGPTLWCCR